MALNFWQSGGDFSDLEKIGTEPESVHRSLSARLKALERSDGQCPLCSGWPTFPCINCKTFWAVGCGDYL